MFSDGFIEVDNLKKVESILKKSNIFYEVVAEVQNDIFELNKTFSIKIIIAKTVGITMAILPTLFYMTCQILLKI